MILIRRRATSPKPRISKRLREYLLLNPGAQHYVRPAKRISLGNRVTPLAHGDVSFAALKTALERAQDEIYIVSWWIEPGLELDRSNWRAPKSARQRHELERIILARARAGVRVRIIIWEPFNAKNGAIWYLDRSLPYQLAAQRLAYLRLTKATRKFRKQLRKISRKNDLVLTPHPDRQVYRLPIPIRGRRIQTIFFYGGSHHQKIWITRSGDNLIGFVGGVNLRQHDWDTADHQVLDHRRSKSDRLAKERIDRDKNGLDSDYPPRHDWMSEVKGVAALHLWEEFRLRWKAAGKKDIKLPRGVYGALTNRGGELAEIVHTLPKEMKGGSREIEAAYLEVIKNAKHYLYIEDQYWTSESLTQRLMTKLIFAPQLQVIFVVPNKAEDAAGFLIAAEQWHQLQRLKQIAGRRLRILTPMRKHPTKPGYVDIYVHAKFAIADDMWLTIGSANTNNRSMFIDTECNINVINGRKAKDTRKEAWRHMLDSSIGGDSNPLRAIRTGWDPIVRRNDSKIRRQEELDGLVVTLPPPKIKARLPKRLRRFL